MAWPTDDLTNTETDQATDDPTQARAELNAAILKVKAILAEITAGATAWHSSNDGSGSGLDADTVDGNEGSTLLARANHTGTQTLSTISDSGSLAALSTVNNGNWSGTDLSVANGGSGRSTATVNGVLVGGTTATGAHQSVAPGTSGQVLTSNGVASPPTFQDGAGVVASDFAMTSIVITPSSASCAGTKSWNPGFGTNDYSWGISALSRGSTDLLTNEFELRARDGNNGEIYLMDYNRAGATVALPPRPSQTANTINFEARMESGVGATNITLYLWARKNI